MTNYEQLADRIEASSGLNIAEQAKKPGPVWFMPLDDDDQHTIVAALRAASRPAQEPVSWQVRYMYDKGHAREKEWCDWRNTNKRWFDKINADIAAGVQRVEARALYAAPVSLTGEVGK